MHIYQEGERGGERGPDIQNITVTCSIKSESCKNLIKFTELLSGRFMNQIMSQS